MTDERALADGSRPLGMRLRRAELRQIGIKKTEGVRRFDDANAGGALLVGDLIAEGLHPGPMHLGPEMMFGVVTVEEPDPVVELVVTAHAPGDRFVGITAVMAIVAVQIRQAVAKIPERQEKTDVAPIQNSENKKVRHEQCELGNSPERFARIFAL